MITVLCDFAERLGVLNLSDVVCFTCVDLISGSEPVAIIHLLTPRSLAMHG